MFTKTFDEHLATRITAKDLYLISAKNSFSYMLLRRHTNQHAFLGLHVFLGVHVFEYGLCLYLDYIPVRVVPPQASEGNEVPASVIRNGEKSPTLFSSFTAQVFLRCIFSSRL